MQPRSVIESSVRGIKWVLNDIQLKNGVTESDYISLSINSYIQLGLLPDGLLDC